MKTNRSAPKNFNTIEVEFRYQDLTQVGDRRKITIPHGQFRPPAVIHNRDTNQWFIWCAGVEVYQEVEGSILQLIEVS